MDEAHDLPLTAQHIVAGWKNTADETRYLLVACDRHQRLRLAGHGAMIIDGLRDGGFSQHTLRLRRNYRSPFPVYAASLGLMFRWFAKEGPKIIPLRDELVGAFGFKIEPREAGQPWVLGDINDSHPSNHWCYTVSRFLSPQDALRQIRFLQRDDVLWVRFCEEDPFFNYEDLSAFTYHPLDGGGVADLIDKYIKGQEFNVVVIEGLPPHAIAPMPSPVANVPDEKELRMWQARRELYLCASRANVFLFFVLKSGTSGEGELEEMLRHVRAPYAADRRLWKLEFGDGQPTRRLGDIEPTPAPVQPVETQPVRESIVTLHLSQPVTFGALVAALRSAKGLDPRTALEQCLEAVAPLGLTSLGINSPLPTDHLGEVEDCLGILINVEAGQVRDAEIRQPDRAEPAAPAAEPTENALLRAGITVEEAATVLGLNVQRLLAVLPLPYQRATILTLNDLERLASLKQHQPASQTPAQVPPVVAVQGGWQSPLAEQLGEFLQQPNFRREQSSITKYVLFLSELVRLKPDAVGILLDYRPRTRSYFAPSREELVRELPYASVHALRHGGLFAMSTLSDASKFTVLRKVLADCDLPPGDIRRLLGGF